ncbi:MAG: S8 family serine peptidase [Sulfurifustaceae bacterium]
MFRRCYLAASVGGMFLAAVSVSSLAAALVMEPGAAGSVVPDEVLVKFRGGMEPQVRAAAIAEEGDQVALNFVANGYALVKLQGARTLADALAAYAARADVESVQPNYRYQFAVVPNDPQYGQLWALKNNGQTVNGENYSSPKVPGNDLHVEEVWDRRTDCSPVIVAVLDSGVNYTHQDLAANMWDGGAAGLPNHGFDFVDNDNDPMPSDANGHGTHVAATIGAVGNNGLGVTGVCWKASLMAVRIGDNSGATTARIAQGLDFAVAHGAKVVNLSLTGANLDPAFQDRVEAARRNGVILVTAAGNEAANNDATPAYPCNFTQDNILCVAALDQAYNLASFSNFGATSVDVGAPGTNILSAWPGPTVSDDLTGWTRTGGWQEIVCPFTAGVLHMLVDPANWCSAMTGYAANANDVAFKRFDLSGASHAQLAFRAFVDLEPGRDFLGVARSAGGGDPFAANPGSVLETSGSTNGTTALARVSLNDCLAANCTVGFRLRSNETVNQRGVGILDLRIDTTQANSAEYRVDTGTSMAAPHVAGVVALVWAQKPSATYTEVINAVKLGGDSVSSLAAKTLTGRAVNAAGALRMLEPGRGAQ